ncbi:hypothetical protein L1049_027303 [Liquidambar formosana]|uniref:Uncharacterized protein n=1 Tax=Liquidambar formosana TaxID=63359 RepID=A0AAP0N276_LIQFO
MAPGDRSRKRKALPPGHSTSQTNSSSVNTNSSNSSKKGRGPSTNAALDKATSGGRKVFLDIPDNKVKPVGQWASSFATEVGIICRTWANPSMEKWGDISTEDKDFMCKKILASKQILDLE